MGKIISFPLLLAMLGYFVFFGLSVDREVVPDVAVSSAGRIVMSAPALLIVSGGDRFLAANLETMRLSATGVDAGFADADYLIRAQRVVSELNACQEQNYYLANALLTWGGAVEDGDEILRRATRCRFWDELPPFFYGFNQFFFKRDIESAAEALEVAAIRATSNSAGFRKFAIMLRAESIKDEGLALDFLRQERDRAGNVKLREMLTKRIVRLEGLVLLREAQRRYEAETGGRLSEPSQLIVAGFIERFPEDPLKLGYVFENGYFMLKKLKVLGVEER